MEEEVHRARSRRVPSAAASLRAELGCTPLLARTCVHQPASSQNPALQALLWRLCHVGDIDRSFIHSPAPRPSPENGGGAGSPELLSMA